MTENPRVLLVEDDSDWLEIYREYLHDEGYLLDTARSTRQAIELLSQFIYDAVVTDLKMLGFGADFGGFGILQKTKELNPDTQVVVITGYGSRDIALRAMQQGAFDYVTKPPEAERLRLSVRAAIQARRVLAGKRVSTNETGVVKGLERASLDTRSDIVFSGFIANSRGMRIVYEQMVKAISTSSSVLIYGEPGTGKGFIANMIHANSQRQKRPFSRVRCDGVSMYWSNIVRNLPRIQGGTLFFDSITDLCAEDQKNLLNIIPTIEMHDIRLMASANVGQEEIIKTGIPASLLQIIAQIRIAIPPLRERKDGDDIPALIGYFINKSIEGMENHPSRIVLSSEAMRLLLEYDYRMGNIHELHNIIENAVNLLGGEGTILPEHILLPTSPLPPDRSITILFLAADPTDASRLRLGEEFREIQEKLKLAKLREKFRLELPQLSLRPADISQALLDMEPQIVHFSGHGTSTGALCFENPTGQAQLVKPDSLAALFKQFAKQVKCVLLNACYSETQAKAIGEYIQYVIGMNQAISDKAAIAFAVGFYQALGAGRTIEDAYKLGCVQIGLQGIPEHLTPVLIKDGQLQT